MSPNGTHERDFRFGAAHRPASRPESLADAERALAVATGSARSTHGEVSVSVDAGGRVRAIAFGSTAYRALSPSELASLVLTTVKAAEHDLRATLLKLIEPFLPPDHPTADLLAGLPPWLQVVADTGE